jgi:hypothetical protein
MWEPERLTTQWASTACYKDSYTRFYLTPKYSPSRTILEFCSVFIYSAYVDRFTLKLIRLEDASEYTVDGNS